MISYFPSEYNLQCSVVLFTIVHALYAVFSSEQKPWKLYGKKSFFSG